MQSTFLHKGDDKALEILYIHDDLRVSHEIGEILQESYAILDICQDTRILFEQITSKYYDLIIINITSIQEREDVFNEIQNIYKNIALVSFFGDNEDFLSQVIEKGLESYMLYSYSVDNVLYAIDKVVENIHLKKEVEYCADRLEELSNDSQQQISFHTYYDKLTNIYNYSALLQNIKKLDNLCLILLNIDHFNNINSAYGYDFGDKVLLQTVKYLKLIKPKDYELYRLGSDEFVYLGVSGCNKEEDLKLIADSITSFFSMSELSVENIDIKISFSVGIAVGSGAAIINEAKTAIKELREYHRGSYLFYSKESEFLKHQENNVYWISKMKEAILERNIVTFFQPMMNNKTKKIDKYECLARIKDDEILVSPIRFMEAAKITSMLPFITRAVIEQSCEMFSQNDFEFSINVTREDFHLNYIKDYLLKYTKKYNIESSRVVLEILEDISSLNQPDIMDQLISLREAGFKIAIDDFGNENSNFSRLLDYNPDYIKIDGAFIKNILEDEKSQIITESIVFLAKRSNIKIIAEFVHSKEVQEKMIELGIDYSQGYYFGEPSSSLKLDTSIPLEK